MKFIQAFFTKAFVLASVLSYNLSLAQQPALNYNLSSQDTTKLFTDSIGHFQDTTSLEEGANISYSAADSMQVNLIENAIYLYGKARVSYKTFQLDANYIKYDRNNQLIVAKGRINPKSNQYQGKPIFVSELDPPITADSLAYNYQTKKGKFYNATSSVEDGFLRAKQSKKDAYDQVSIKDATYSTCDLPEPYTHYGIYVKRGIITKHQIITGPARLVIEHVPTPIILPFGFFPKPNKRSSGLIFPNFGEDGSRGFFMHNLGYYIGISNYWDARLQGTIYSKGSYEAGVLGRYKKRYKYNGQLNAQFASTRNSNALEGTPLYLHPKKDFNIQWEHAQDPKANPGTSFSAHVNAATSTYFSNTAGGGTYDIDQLSQNSLSSNITYGKTLADGLFNLSVGLTDDQDLQARTISMKLPTLTLGMTTLYPFDSKKKISGQDWYQRLSLGYTMEGNNVINSYDSLLFKKEGFAKFQTALKHGISISLPLKLLRFFNLNSEIQYNERWYLQTIRETYLPNNNQFQTDTLYGFSRSYDYTLSTSLSTKLYGQVNFKRGSLVAIRHVITPSIGWQYHPDFSNPYYNDYRYATLPDGSYYTPSPQTRYSIYASSPYPSLPPGKWHALTFSLDNNIEAKVHPKRDTSNALRKIPVLQSATLSGTYNFAADTFRLSTLNLHANTALFQQKLRLNFDGTLDPYKIDAHGNRMNTLAIRQGKVGTLTNYTLTLDCGLSSTASTNNKKPNDQNTNINQRPNEFVDFNIPWTFNVSYSLNYVKTYPDSVYTFFSQQRSYTNTLNFSGDFSFTPNWKIQYTSGYDFNKKDLSFTQFSIYRNLHCWEMSIKYIPFGAYKGYTAEVRVKSPILHDIKLNRSRYGY